jgi:hypothetical protein
MKSTRAIALLLLLAMSPALFAASHIVDFDREVDFTTVKTFTLRGAEFLIDRPEIRSPLVAGQVTAAIRAALLARGLRETAQDADVLVDWSVRGQRFAINEWGRAIPLDNSASGWRLPPGNPWRDLPESFVEGVLVLDLTARSSGLLVWRGVYRDNERDSARVGQRLPDYARQLFVKYPPVKKK